MAKKEAKRLRRYRKLAKAIHALACRDPEWCNYGEPTGDRRLRREGDPVNDREHLIQHCLRAVDAENLAARFCR